jgi:hypothetical protein
MRKPSSRNRGGSQHRCQIPFQLDLEFALVRRQDDGVDEAAKRLRGLRAGLWMLQGLSQRGDFLSVHVGHSGVPQWWWFVRGLKLGV